MENSFPVTPEGWRTQLVQPSTRWAFSQRENSARSAVRRWFCSAKTAICHHEFDLRDIDRDDTLLTIYGRLIDDFGEFRQGPPTMRFKTYLSLVLLASPLSSFSQADGPQAGITRKLSLQDTFRLALEQNYNIEIGDKISLGLSADLDLNSGGRLGLELARINQHQDYAAYDPEFVATAGKNFTRSSSGFIIGSNFISGASETWRQNYSAGIQGYLPSGGTYDLSTGVDRTSRAFAQYDTSVGLTLSQPLLRNAWGYGGTEMGIKLRKLDVKITELNFRLLVMDTLRKVAVAYYDLAAARGEIKVQEKALELANQLVAENKKKVEVGNMAPLDERQAESQAASAKAALSRAIFTAQSSELTLKSLITREYNKVQSEVMEPTESLVALYQAFNLTEAWRTALETRPDYLQQKQSMEKDRIGLSFTKNQMFPSLDVSASYARNGLSGSTSGSGGSTLDSYDTIVDNRFPNYGGFLTLRIPLTFRKERDNLKQAKLAIKSSIIALKQKEDAVVQEVDLALKSIKSAYEQTQSTREARKFAEEALVAEQKKLENGKSTSFQVLQIQKDLTTASSAEIQAIAEYNKALHDFYFREGTTLERNKVNLELK